MSAKLRSDKHEPSKERSLKDLQEFVFQSISQPLTVRGGMRKRALDGSSIVKSASQLIKPGSTLSSFQRLEIYNQQYWYRLLDVLEDDFPGLKAILGPERFGELLKRYVDQCPSSSYSLRDMGAELPDFVQTHPDLTDPETSLCVETARFEWAQVVAFDEPALEPVSLDFLQNGVSGDLRVSLQPYMTLMKLEHALDEYSLALRRLERDRSEAGQKRKSSRSAESAPHPVPETVYLVIHRHKNVVYFKRLEEAAFVILWQLSSGNTLEESLACIIELESMAGEDIGKKIQSWFALFVSLGWLCPRSDRSDRSV